MNINKDKTEIFCHICNNWKDKHTEIYFEDNQVKCLDCDILLGYTHDFSDKEDFNG